MVTMALLFACFMFIGTHVYAASNDEVTLIVSADGSSKDEAVKLALRSAIEQTYGTFVSANTTILNDELVKDEIVTVTNGNIKNYEESSSNIVNGKTYITLKATVCISKLVSYAQSKGVETKIISPFPTGTDNATGLYCKVSVIKPSTFLPTTSCFIASTSASAESADKVDAHN